MTPTVTDKLELDQARALIGDRLPKFKGTLPAAWWISTDPQVVDGHDRYRSAFDAWDKRVFDLADELGVDAVRPSTYGVRGFVPTEQMSSDHTLVPAGWRIDTEASCLLPSLQAGADCEAPTARRFADLGPAPQAGDYFPALSLELYVPGGGNGSSFNRYRPRYWRVENAVIAVMFADPDRVPGTDNAVDDTIWHRQRLSVLAALVEESAGD